MATLGDFRERTLRIRRTQRTRGIILRYRFSAAPSHVRPNADRACMALVFRGHQDPALCLMRAPVSSVSSQTSLHKRLPSASSLQPFRTAWAQKPLPQLFPRNYSPAIIPPQFFPRTDTPSSLSSPHGRRSPPCPSLPLPTPTYILRRLFPAFAHNLFVFVSRRSTAPAMSTSVVSTWLLLCSNYQLQAGVSDGLPPRRYITAFCSNLNTQGYPGIDKEPHKTSKR